MSAADDPTPPNRPTGGPKTTPDRASRPMIARVTLEFAVGKEYDYLVPEALSGQVAVGTRVKVPFGSRQVIGCVTALAAESSHPRLKPLLHVIGTPGLVTAKVLDLARWIAQYYCCPVETALKSVLPEAVRREAPGWRERLVVRLLDPGKSAPVERASAGDRRGGEPGVKLTRRQREILHLLEERRELPLQELLRLTTANAGTVRRLEDKGLVTISLQVAERDPYGQESFLPTEPLSLNPEQAGALARIVSALDPRGLWETGSILPPASGHVESEGRLEACTTTPTVGRLPHTASLPGPTSRRGGATFLLHGVTGSGKTEIYLQAIAAALERGLGAIVLVPEISLTPQTIERFKARFSHGPLRTLVAVLHSHLSAGERHDEWHKIRQGRARVVIGARSAIFAPVEPLGLIVVDEEHEHSYKQEEAPRYHARDVAVLRGEREGAVVVLGSATPSLESYYNAQRGKYRLLELPTRVDDQRLPLVRVVDMRGEVRDGKGVPMFSRRLRDAINARLERREQTILFLNRRGYSTSLQCPKCGYVAMCPNCSISLTYHRTKQRLCCHICGHETDVPESCPNAECRNPAIRYAGIGTQRVEETLRRLFPTARVQRMDSDVLQRKDDYRRILGDFRAGRTDILLGTQMIAKGLHFPNVTLVGIIFADLSLHVPDFRAAERTFQLLTQVSGRAGRGDVEGEVVVQSFTPFHAAIQCARRHDFAGFYEQELPFRKELDYPPFTRIALLTLRGRNDDKVRFAAGQLRREIEASIAPALQPLWIAGPAPAPLARAETYYRHQIMLRTRRMSRLSQCLGELRERWPLPPELVLTVDVDPANLM